MSYFEDIMEELKQVPKDNQRGQDVKDSIEACFERCQQYIKMDRLRQESKVVWHYLPQSECASSPKRLKSERLQSSMGVPYKLHIDFFWTAYESKFKSELGKKTESQFIKKFVLDPKFEKNIDEVWTELFDEDDPISAYPMGTVKKAIWRWRKNNENTVRIEDLRLGNLHRAMKSINEKLEGPPPSLKESVEEIVSTDALFMIRECLRKREYHWCQMYVTGINYYLYDIDDKKRVRNSRRWLNRPLQYTFKDSERYQESLQKLYEDYISDKEGLDEILGDYGIHEIGN